MVALANRQLATNSYILGIKKKLSEVESELATLRDKLVETKQKHKAYEAMLEEARDVAEGERVGAIVLRACLNEMKSQREAKKEKVANEVVAAYLKSEAFKDG